MPVDPSPAYQAATSSVALFDGDDRVLLTVTGRSPSQMLNGVLTGTMPPVPTEVEPGVFQGRSTYHTALTPKGKIISDLHATLLGPDDGPGFLLDVPAAGRDALLEHFRKFLPPRFAKVTEVSGSEAAAGDASGDDDGASGAAGGSAGRTDGGVEAHRRARLTVVGPDAPAMLSKVALGLRVDATWLDDAAEGEWRSAGDPLGSLLVVRTADVWPPAFHVLGPEEAVSALRKRLMDQGAVEGDAASWDVLRVEAGRPAFGADMDEATLPPEAGITDRAIDHGKGCYTGQEVIVRIRDRGHVNWQLRRLDFGDGSAPAAGDELTDDGDKAVARITSVVSSPRAGGVLALAYVRREVDEVRFDGRTIPVPEGLPEAL